MRKVWMIGLVLTTTLSMACRNGDDDPKLDGPITQLDGTPPGQEGGGSGTETTVTNIKKELVKDGAKVIIKNAVITANDQYGKYTGDLYIQDPAGGEYSGINLYINQRTDGGQITDLNAGDNVRVEGTVSHWNGPPSNEYKDGKYVIQLENTSITFIKAGTAKVSDVTAAQITKAPDAVKWEGALVKVSNVKVLTEPDKEYGDFKVTGGLSVAADLFPGNPPVGDCVNVTGIAGFFYFYRLNPRSDKDIATSTGCVPAKSVTIKDIQDATSANHPAENTEVKVKGVITAIDGSVSSGKYYDFFIQDGTGPYSGIKIYHSWADSDTKKPVVGDEIEYTGTYVEHYDLSELKDGSWTVLGQKAVPAPEVIANPADIATNGSKAEEFEGVLVKVENIEVGEIAKDSKGKPVGFKDKASSLMFDKAFYDFTATVNAGDKFTSVTGPLDYTFSNFKILPRDAADMVK